MTNVHVAEGRGGIASWRWVIPLSFTAILSTLSALRYHLYLAQGWDLGFYEQGLWSLYHHGLFGFSSWGHYPVLSLSVAWVLWPLSVPYHLLGLGFLLVLQAFAYGVGFVFLYDWMKFKGYSWDTIYRVGWVYLLNPIAWGVVLFDFHPAILAVPAILASITLADRNLPRASIFWLAFALLCQDLVVPIALWLGLLWCLQRRYAIGVGALALAAFAAAADTVVLHHLGTGFSVQEALYFGAHKFSPMLPTLGLRQAEYLTWIIVPMFSFGFNIGHARWLVPILAIIGLDLVSNNMLATSPFSQFAILLIPFTLMILTSAAFHPAPDVRRKLSTLLYGLFFIGALAYEVNLKHLAPPITQDATLSHAISVIPSAAPVIAQNQVAPHLAERQTLLPLATTTSYPVGSYVILNTDHSLSLSVSRIRRIATAALSQGHTVYSTQGIIVIHILRPSPGGN